MSKRKTIAVAAVVFVIGSGAAACGESAGTTSAPAQSTGAQSASAQTAPKHKAKPKLTMTVSQQQAVESAQSYLEMGGFSRKGLIQQLSSSAGEGFTHAQAVYATNAVGL